jgi:Rha family phage regulatory protein
MEQLVYSGESGREVTTSLIVAKIFDKNHADVLRDIRNLHCSDDFRERNFAERLIPIVLATGESRQKYYEVTRDGFSFLVMGYTGEKAAQFKEQFIAEFNKRELMLKSDEYILSRAFEIATKRMKSLEAQLYEKDEKLKLTEAINKENEPKVQYYNEVLTSETGYPITIIAKDLGMSAQRLNEILHEYKVIYKVRDTWVLYAKYQGRGFTKTYTFTHPDKTGTKLISEVVTTWTEVGRQWLMTNVRSVLMKGN